MTTTIDLTYRDRIALLREKKLQQTQAKVAKFGYMNSDDHGFVLPPADFSWKPATNHANGHFYGTQLWGENFRSLLEAHPTYVDPLDAFAGRMMAYLRWFAGGEYDWFNPDLRDPAMTAEQRKYGIVSGMGGPQHFCPELPLGLQLGWGGLLEKIRHYRDQHGPEKAVFYEAEENCVLGIQDWIRRTITAIHAAEAEETRPELKANLREMAAVNEWVLTNPPRTMREACQWVIWYNMASRIFNGDGAGYRLDVLLQPYYERDLAAGLIDDEAAIYYLACLLLNDPQYYQLGGPDAEGKDVTTHLSYLVLEAAHRMGIACNLTVRVHDGLDPAFFRKAVTHLFEDRKAWPRFCNETAVSDGFVKNGYSRALARQRISVGCHWTAIPGREYTLNDCVKINVARVFEVAWKDMLAEASEAPSVDRLWELFAVHLRAAVLCTARGLDLHLDHQHENAPELLINLLCYGTLEQGLDASNGGVEFYNMCVDGAGLATVADSFAALEQRIEREGVLTWEEIIRHITDNYAGVDGERVRLMMKRSDRYGKGNALGDAWAVRVSQLFTALVKAQPTPKGRNMIPGWFSWSNTIGMGKALGATPNGRHASAPISHGANPDPGFRKDGAPTAMARAIAAVQPGYGNAAPIQMEVDPGLSKEEGGIEKVASLIKTHFDLGGTLFNINVLDKETLLAAHADPSQYPDLVVRVTGFTAFFASLSPDFRQLVVDRFLAEA